jgi:hypothetical protein
VISEMAVWLSTLIGLVSSADLDRSDDKKLITCKLLV